MPVANKLIVLRDRPVSASELPLVLESAEPLPDTVGAMVGAGLPVVEATEQLGTVLMVSAVVLTVPPNASALPVHTMVLPIVMPDASMSVPRKVVLAPSVVAAAGVHQVLHADAPLASLIAELAADVSAPVILNIYVPPPVRVTLRCLPT